MAVDTVAAMVATVDTITVVTTIMVDMVSNRVSCRVLYGSLAMHCFILSKPP